MTVDTPTPQSLAPDFETVLCPICRTATGNELDFGQFKVLECDGCGLGVLSPRPTANSMTAYYAADTYAPFLSSRKTVDVFGSIYRIVRKLSLRWKHRWVSRYANGKSLIDIGCGTGEFLVHMRSRGWQVQGVEPSPDAARVAKDQYQLRISEGHFDRMEAGDLSASVVTLWHALEHMHDPVSALRGIHGMLDAEGLLVIAVPNRLSLDARLYGTEWVAYDIPRHLYHFTPDSMRQMLWLADFEVEHFHQMPLDAVFNVFMSELNTVKRLGYWTAPLFVLRGGVTLLATLFWAMFSKQGSAVIYYARKRRHAK